MAFNFSPAFRQMLSTRGLKVNLESSSTPKSFSQLLLLIVWFSITMFNFSLELQIKWHLPGLAFIWLS